MAEPDTLAANWNDATRVASAQRPRLGFDLDTDVCVIGGGLAGLTVAREVARRGWAVAVLEANRIAWAASGRNTGFVLPGFSEDVDSMVERVGLDHAKQLWQLSEGGLDYVRRTIAETGMPGVNPVDGWLNISKTDNDDEIRTFVERLRWIGVNIEMWPTERVRSVLPSRHYFNAVHYPRAFHIQPLNYALGLAGAARGGRRAHLRGHAGTGDRCGRRAQTHHHAGRARARFARGARGQRASGAADAAARLDADADHDLRDRERAVGQFERGAALSRRRYRRQARRQPLSHRRRRRHRRGKTGMGRAHDGVAGRPPLVRARSCRRYQAQFSRARKGQDRAPVVRHLRPLGASHAASWRHRARRLGGERLRRAWAQHHGDGRRADCSRHRRKRRYLAAVCALRAGLGGRSARARGGAGGLLGLAADQPDRAGACPLSRTGAPAQGRAVGGTQAEERRQRRPRKARRWTAKRP